jgi:hypothetical protein
MTSWEVVTAIATVVLAVLTGFYVWFTYGLLRTQIAPHVVIYARSDELRPTLIELVIQNVGRGVATDVRFEFSRPMFHRAYGVTEEEAQAHPPRPIDAGALVTGIPALGPGEMRRITWGQFGGLKRALGDEVITATVRFREQGGRECRPVVTQLDVRSFTHTDASERDPMLKLVREMGELRESVASLERGLTTALLQTRGEDPSNSQTTG